MKCTALWFGGVNYAPPTNEDGESFASIAEASRALAARSRNRDGRTPCVESSEMWLYFGASRDYPDMRLTFGPRGGVRRETT